VARLAAVPRDFLKGVDLLLDGPAGKEQRHLRREIELDPTKPAVIRSIGGSYLFSPTGEKV